jgi:asparagine synthetase B (glutamine-hydrolysing)
MCSFFGIKTDNPELIEFLKNNQDKIFRKLKYRGPDIHRIEEIEKNFILAGFVLAINDFVPQPIEKDGAWLVWNGEIYNCPKEYTNDSQYLIELFNNQGTDVIFNYQDNVGSLLSEIDGEYSICYYNKGFLHIITDDFFTKPLCYSLTNNTLIFSSYESAINELDSSLPVIHALPNTYYIFNTNSYQLVSQREIYKWDFEPRYNTFEFWNQAFEESVKKRINTDKKVFLPLSSGYDSGAICCEVLRQNFPCTMYSYLGVENQEILNQRFKLIAESENSNSILVNPREDFDINFKEFYEKAENFVGYHYNGTPYIDTFHAYSCFGHYIICRDAKRKGYDICLSGHGSDEIYSDYYSPNTKSSSTLKGNYTNVRTKWPNFDMGYGRNILGMFERTAGACGIETRYPFLDRNAVQNFLWLSDELKNSSYKQCLHQLMSSRSFPFDNINFKNSLRIFENDKNNQLFTYYLGKFYRQNNLILPKYINKKRLINTYKKSSSKNIGKSSIDFVKRAKSKEKEGDYQEAISLYRQSINRLPNFYLTHLLLAEVLLKNGDFLGAISELKTAIKLNPKSLFCKQKLKKLLSNI